MAAAPASSIACAKGTALRQVSSQPSRNFTVTGTLLSRQTARTISCASDGLRMRALPEPVAMTLCTGQPMLMSIQSGWYCCTMAAARAMNSGSLPNNWIPIGRSSGVMAHSSAEPLSP